MGTSNTSQIAMIKQIAATVTALLLVGVLVALVGHEHSASASENFDTTAFDTELVTAPQCQLPQCQSGTCDTTKTVVGKGYDITQLLNPSLSLSPGMKTQIVFSENDAQDPDDVTWSQVSESHCTNEYINTKSMGQVAVSAANQFAPGLSLGSASLGAVMGLSLGSSFNQNIATAYKSNKQVSLNTCTIKKFKWEIATDTGQASNTVLGLLAKLKAKDSQAEYNAFFNSYGTHVITGAAFGGRYSMQAEYDTFECNSTSSVCGSNTFGNMFGSVVGSVSFSGGGNTCTNSQEQEQVTSAKLTSIIVGGSGDAQTELRNFALDPGSYVDTSQASQAFDTWKYSFTSQASQAFDTWKTSLKCNPELVSINLQPIGAWINNHESRCEAVGANCPSADEWNKALQAYVKSHRFKDVATPPAQCTGVGGGGGGVSCFSDNNTVLASSSRKMLVGEVQVGDRLNTTVEDDEVWWVHKSSVQHKLLRVQLQDSHIDLTPHHMLRVGNGFRPASEVVVGDSVIIHTPKEVLSEVLSITHLSGSVSAPITMSGKIVVNGVEASCYAFGSHQVLHQLLAPFRVLYKLCPWLVQMLSPIGVGTMQALSIVLPIEHNLTPMLTVSTIVALSSPMLAYWAARNMKLQ